MTIIVWMYRSKYVDIGEQKVYRHVNTLIHLENLNFRVSYNVKDKIAQEDWE